MLAALPDQASAEALDEGRQPPVPVAGSLPEAARYGVYRPKQGPNGTWHWGVDLPASSTTPVVAPEHGIVQAVWTDNQSPPWAGYGPAGVLLAGTVSRRFHVLAHMDPTSWRGAGADPPVRGKAYAKGEQIGFPDPTVGHVHWEVRVLPIDSPDTRKANTLDPLLWVAGVDRERSGSPNSGWWIVLLVLLALGKGR